MSAALALVALALPVQAQVDPGAVLRETQRQAQQPALPPALPAKAAAAAADSRGPKVRVVGFRIEGAQRYSDEELQVVLAPYRGSELGFSDMQRAADAIAEHYRRAGWHATALLPQQDLKDGILQIVVLESRLGRVRGLEGVELPGHVPQTLLQRYLARAARPGEPLNLNAVSRATAVANEIPAVRVGSVLTAGARPGETDVVLQVEPRPVLAASFTVDNQDAVSTGEHKVLASLALNSLAGLGEQVSLIGTHSQGKSYMRAAGTLPVGDAGWRVGASASRLVYRLVGDAAISMGSGQPNGARGDASTLGLTATYPILRGPDAGLVLSLSGERRATLGETVLGVTSDKRANVFSATLQADSTDALMGGGALAGSVTVTSGIVDLSRVPSDLDIDARSARVQGRFDKLSITVTRLQRVTEDQSVLLSLNGQIAGRNLDGSEKFSLGGPGGVRAYPVLEGSGDTGAVGSLSWRYQVNSTLRVETFYDHGWIRRQHTLFTGAPLPNSFSLRGAGLVAEYTPSSNWRLSATMARRIGSNPAALPSGRDSDGTLRRWRAWMGLTAAF